MKIIIILVVAVTCYLCVGNEVVGKGVEVIKNHHNQLEEVMEW